MSQRKFELAPNVVGVRPSRVFPGTACLQAAPPAAQSPAQPHSPFSFRSPLTVPPWAPHTLACYSQPVSVLDDVYTKETLALMEKIEAYCNIVSTADAAAAGGWYRQYNLGRAGSTCTARGGGPPCTWRAHGGAPRT